MTEETKPTKEPENVEEEKRDDLAFFDDFQFVLPQKYRTNQPQTLPDDVPPHQKR